MRMSVTNLALRTGAPVGETGLVVSKSQFFDKDAVLATPAFWSKAKRYFQVRDARAVLPTDEGFVAAVDHAVAGDNDPELQHGAERLTDVLRLARNSGVETLVVAL